MKWWRVIPARLWRYVPKPVRRVIAKVVDARYPHVCREEIYDWANDRYCFPAWFPLIMDGAKPPWCVAGIEKDGVCPCGKQRRVAG